MDGLVLGFYLLATFLGGLTTGVAGFAMGLVVSGIWLHIITPVQTATLIVLYTLLTQSYSILKLRHALDWQRLAPFVIGSAAGAPAGVALLTRVDPGHMRSGIGVLLVIFSAYNLLRPSFKPVQGNLAADLAIGFSNGLLGGLTGLGGIIVTVWCQLRGWPKDLQRAIFQPVILASGIVTVASYGVAGVITNEVLWLYALGLPTLAAGLWIGFRLYGKLDDAAFRKVVLWLLLVSGLSLVVPLVMLR
jgi:uncharacterized membrane protein YfcA